MNMDDIIAKLLEYTLVGTVTFVVYLNKKIIQLEKDCAIQNREIRHLECKIQEVQDDNRSCKNYERNNKTGDK